jgi:hypothetical protein
VKIIRLQKGNIEKSVSNFPKIETIFIATLDVKELAPE